MSYFWIKIVVVKKQKNPKNQNSPEKQNPLYILLRLMNQSQMEKEDQSQMGMEQKSLQALQIQRSQATAWRRWR